MTVEGLEGSANQLSCVMKFGGSSVASADRMKEVAELILSFPEENPLIVLSAMGKTTNKHIVAGEKAASCISDVSEIDELSFVKELHYRTVDELVLDRSIIIGKSFDVESSRLNSKVQILQLI
ncbi:putative aspartate kinase [Helianthus annuus]|nr:putative aspartate kinase [Helianthus annuus]KAJ0461138.1 putative aspartate kinase [Helianthus annuus]KAJ0645452.1 putative aspartate kinase [Helianthus annuus]